MIRDILPSPHTCILSVIYWPKKGQNIQGTEIKIHLTDSIFKKYISRDIVIISLLLFILYNHVVENSYYDSHTDELHSIY